METLGQHLLVEFYKCKSELLNDPDRIESIMIQSAEICKARVVDSKFHKFSPFGVSGIVIISESHLAVHTWPEYNYAAVDLFTCGKELRPDLGFAYLKKAFHADSQHITLVQRGRLNLMNSEIETNHLNMIKESHNQSIQEFFDFN